nr:hypothetical protein [Myxococcales bacterium]
VVNIENKLFIPTTMPNRGQVTDQAGALVPQELLADPFVVTGVDGQQHTVHPGAFFDETESYLFEDAASGLFDISTALNNPVYYTDSSSGEPNFQGFQKIINGALPWGAARNARGDRIWVTMSGSRQVQEFAVVAAAQQSLSPLRTLNTNHRPLGVALDEVNNLLYVSNYMGETLDVFDLADVNAVDPIQRIDLGYAVPLFPATNMEVGELFFNDTDISNDGDKSCVSCHYDELDLDGIGFANGTGTPTGYKQIKPQHNLARTGPWFWNGGMGNGNYTSTAYSFQTRTNCDMIQFAFVEGPSSNPATRIGDPFNFTEASNVAQELQDNPLFAQLVDPADVAALNDAACRPENVVQGIPANAAEIAAQNNIQKRIVAALIQARSLEVMGEEAAANLGFPQGVERQELAFFVDLYSNGEIRLPPNPLQQMRINNQLSTAQETRLDQGEQLFASSGCGFCHNPNDQFIDRRNHGPGNDWLERFEQEFRNDPSILAIGGFQQPFLQSLANNVPDQTVNVHIDPIESFTPICPVVDSCLRFFDPIQANGAERQRRLDLQIAVNLGDDERQFLPSNPPGLPSVNTPTLRGTWSRGPGLMHHTHAKNVAQAILPPGHSYLKPGEVGYNATTTNGVYDVHGATSRLNDDQARALIEYVNSIE